MMACLSVSPECIGIGPGQLECLSHDEPAEYLVESVSVLWLADDQILQFGILREGVVSIRASISSYIYYLHPHRVFRFDSRFERHCLVIHGLHEEIVNQLLLSFVRNMFEQSVTRYHLPSELTKVKK